MLSIILSVLRKSRPVRVQAALVISYYRSVVIEGTAPGVGRGKELLLSVEDGVHPNPVARGLAQRVRNRYIYIGDGCEGYSSNLFIPAKSELTSEDKTLTRHVFFLDFNDEYQDLTKYSLIEQLNLPQLTAKELEELPNRLTALQPMTLNHLKE